MSAISTKGVMPTYTSHVLFFFFASATNRSMPKPCTGAIFASSGCFLPYSLLIFAGMSG